MNTSISDLNKRLVKFRSKLLGQKRKEKLELQSELDSELVLEIEKLIVGPNFEALVVYTGDLVHVTSKEIIKRIIDTECIMATTGGGSVSGNS